MICPSCASNDIEKFLYLKDIPTISNLVYKTYEEALTAPVADVDLLVCKKCTFIYNQIFCEDDVVYTSDYNNNQFYSTIFKDYINEQIDRIIANYIKKDDVIVEIGCGKGYFIRELLKKTITKEVKCGYGFDTTYDGEEYIPELNLRYYRSYYNEQYRHLNPNIIILRHVIEHIKNPVDFLKPIYDSLSENTIVFIETPNVDWILQNGVVYDFSYEHCSYYNPYSISVMLENIGFEVLDITDEFGGQYMLIVAMVSRKRNLDKELFERRLKQTTDELYGKVSALWGAGAKGITFVNQFDKKRQLIKCLIDINEGKQNKFAASTGHIIISPDDIFKYGINKIFVLNANYYDEIVSKLHELGLTDIEVTII